MVVALNVIHKVIQCCSDPIIFWMVFSCPFRTIWSEFEDYLRYRLHVFSYPGQTLAKSKGMNCVHTWTIVLEKYLWKPSDYLTTILIFFISPLRAVCVWSLCIKTTSINPASIDLLQIRRYTFMKNNVKYSFFYFYPCIILFQLFPSFHVTLKTTNATGNCSANETSST